jgi:hypothetical protein
LAYGRLLRARADLDKVAGQARLGITPRPGTPPPALASKLSDEHLLAHNIPFCASTAESPAGAEFVHIGGPARGYLAVGGPFSSPRMAYWMTVCSVYLYIAILGANVRICGQVSCLA